MSREVKKLVKAKELILEAREHNKSKDADLRYANLNERITQRIQSEMTQKDVVDFLMEDVSQYGPDIKKYLREYFRNNPDKFNEWRRHFAWK